MVNRQGVGEGILNFLFPQHCVACHQYIADSAGYPLCESCEAKIKKEISPYCFICGRPLSNSRQTKCRRCRDKPFSFDFARAISLYEPPMKNAIHAFKYQKIVSLRYLFISLLVDYLNQNPLFRDVDAILPVPLHPSRHKEREFNQSEILARGVSRALRIPCIQKSVTRVKKTKPQVGLSMRERRLNLQNAFKVEDDEMIKKKKILIIDDVITSRSTVENLSKALRQSGCQSIFVLALATGK